MKKVTKLLRTSAVNVCGALILLPWRLVNLPFFWACRKYRKSTDAKRMLRSIDWAEKLAEKTGYRYMVLRINGKYIVKPKQVWKQLCKCNGKYFNRGTTIQHLENKAIFITK